MTRRLRWLGWGLGFAVTLSLLACGQDRPGPSPANAPSAGATTASVGSVAGSVAGSAAGSQGAVTPEASALVGVVPPDPDAPRVDLGGLTHLAGPLPAGASRVAALRWVTRLHAEPKRSSRVIGYLRTGAVVAVKAGDVGSKKRCKAGWRQLAVGGFLCMNDATAELDHPVAKATRRRPDFTRSLPYMYGTVTRGGPVYARLPSDEHLATYEPNLKRHLKKWREDKVSGAAYGLDVWLRYNTSETQPLGPLEALAARTTDGDIPAFLSGGGLVPNVSGLVKSQDAVKIDQINRRQGRSFTHSFLYEGRRYNVTPDLAVMPADRFRPIRGSSFHGWQVDKELRFPFALIRRSGAKKWQWRSSSKRMVKSGPLAWRSAVQLTGKKRFYKKRLYYQSEEGFWVDDRHASRIDPARRWPKWAKQGGKWIDVNLTKQVLVAYEGKKMVFATIISSGEDGLGDPDSSTATKRGIFRIHAKWVSVTMDSDVVGEEFELRDVPYVQYFEGGYALHGAYWHDSFGRPKSHGCINLAPEDARRLFFWTEPQLPRDWHGVRKSLTGTIVFVHP